MIVLICLVGGVIGYVCHIFSADDDGEYSVRYMMTTCEQEYRVTENNLILSTPHDEMVIVGDEPDMKRIVAVYAVLAGAPEGDFPTADEDDQALFEEVFDAMYSISFETSERETNVLREYVDAQGNIYTAEETVIQTVLTIERYTLTADEVAEHFNFNRNEREHLDTLLSAEFDEMWEALLY